jgi:hypothetical protein
MSLIANVGGKPTPQRKAQSLRLKGLRGRSVEDGGIGFHGKFGAIIERVSYGSNSDAKDKPGF